MLKRIKTLMLAAFALSIMFCESGLAQSVIVLRDLTLIKSKTISSFDRTSITLSDGSTLEWDEILKATLAADQQEAFDRNIREVGLPMFRLKTRIKQGNWTGAGQISEPIFEATLNQGTERGYQSIELEYLVCLATMKSRLRSGNRSGAVLPFEKATTLQPSVDEQTLAIVGANRLPVANNQAILSPDLLPVWFDNDQLKTSADQIFQTLQADQQGKPSERLAIYLASMRIELGQNESANTLLKTLESDRELVRSWRIVLQARMLQRAGEHVKSQTLLDQNSKSLSGAARPVAIYYRGLSGMKMLNSNRDQAEPENNLADDFDLAKSTLMLMRIPSLYGNTYPGLSAAALFQATEVAKLRGRNEEAEKLRRHLVRSYPWTYHGSIESEKLSARK